VSQSNDYIPQNAYLNPGRAQKVNIFFANYYLYKRRTRVEKLGAINKTECISNVKETWCRLCFHKQPLVLTRNGGKAFIHLCPTEVQLDLPYQQWYTLKDKKWRKNGLMHFLQDLQLRWPVKTIRWDRSLLTGFNMLFNSATSHIQNSCRPPLHYITLPSQSGCQWIATDEQICLVTVMKG